MERTYASRLLATLRSEIENKYYIKTMDFREEFMSLLRSTKRRGIEYVIEDLESLDFFKAPASSRFHLNREGGLVEHSVNVCRAAMKVRKAMLELDDSLLESLPLDSVVIASLLHDVCKADIYKKAVRYEKGKDGKFGAIPVYEVDYSNFPLGHGEKSVIMLLQSGLELTDDEIMAIRWHMNAWDLPFQSADIRANYNAAKTKSPLVTLIQSADCLAAGILERGI